jgi:hypothetical protein
MLAARGARETEQGVVTIDDPGVVRGLQAQASRIRVEAVAIAVVAIAVVMLARGLLMAYLPPMLYGPE